jgi:alpha-L-arabinofuranosidase
MTAGRDSIHSKHVLGICQTNKEVPCALPVPQIRLEARRRLARGHAAAPQDLDCLLASVVHDEETGRVTLFALNRADQAMDISLELRGFGACEVAAETLHHDDLKAVNTKLEPDAVAPRKTEASLRAGVLHATAQPHSWNVTVLKSAS